MTRKPMAQDGVTTYDTLAGQRCHCNHIMRNHQIWASQIVCLEPRCTGVQDDGGPEVVVKVCWDIESGWTEEQAPVCGACQDGWSDSAEHSCVAHP